MAKFRPKSLARKARDRFLADLPNAVSKLEAQLETIQNNQDKLLELAQQIAGRVINSGTFKLSDDEVVTKIFSGAKMHLDPKDVGFVPNLVLDGDWERNITKAWLSVVKKGDVVVDIGANFGYYGILAAQFTERKSKNILFEANPNLIRYIKKSLVENSFEECSIVENLAIAEKAGRVKLNILKDFIASSSLHSPENIDKYMHGKMPIKVESSVTVQAITLDEYCAKNNIQSIDLIKMDIEGYEDKAYDGMRNIVRSSPNLTMFVEFTRDAYDNPKNFYDEMLKDFGQVYLIDLEGNLIKPEKSSYSHIIGSSNGWTMPVFSKKRNLA